MRYSHKYLEEEYVGITRENYSLWANSRKWNKVIWVAGLSSKVICEQDQERCWKENVENLAAALNDFPCEKFIYVSSAAIYQETFGEHRENEFNTLVPSGDQNLSWYGKCKLDGEHLVRQKTKEFLIFRPNGFVGPGLRKNVVYDLTRPEPKLYMSWDSRLQFTHVDFFAQLTIDLSSNYSREVINIAPEGSITPAEIAVALNIDMKAVKMPKDIVVPKLSVSLNVSKLQASIGFPLQSNTYAILNWNNGI